MHCDLDILAFPMHFRLGRHAVPNGMFVQRGSLTGPPFWKNPETAQNDRKSANRGLENWNRPEDSIRGADQKDRGPWERE